MCLCQMEIHVDIAEREVYIRVHYVYPSPPNHILILSYNVTVIPVIAIGIFIILTIRF